jgi:hypothetical protein
MVSAQAPTRFSSVHRPRSVSVAVLAVAVVVLAAVLTTAVVRHNAVAKLDLPAASPLTNTIVVASGLTTPLESGEASSSASGPALIAFDGTHRAVPIAEVPDPYGNWQADFGTALIGGDVVVLEALARTSPLDDGTAVAVRPRTHWQRSLGEASQVFAGTQPGTVWKWFESNGSLCTLSEVSVDGPVLHEIAAPCTWTLLGVTAAGPVIANDMPGAHYVGIWSPTSRRLIHRLGISDTPGQVADGLAVTSAFQSAADNTGQVVLTNLNKVGHHTVDLHAAPGMAFPWYESAVLSPNGRYIAVEETTLAYDRQQLRDAAAPGIVNVPATPTSGLVAVFDTASGRLVLQRKLSLLSTGTSAVEWSPDGSWLFVAASQTTIAAVPMYSASAPVHILRLANSVDVSAVGAVGANNFVLVPSAGNGER